MPARSAFLWPLLLGLAVPGLGAAEERVLECRAQSAAGTWSWQVRLDPDRKTAVVNDQDLAAEYAPSHVRIPLPAEGRTLFIGLVSGRLVVSALDGATLAAGKCNTRVWV